MKCGCEKYPPVGEKCEDCKARELSESTETAGYVEKVPEGEKGFGRYKYRVIARNGFPNHHTNSKNDAERWLDKCRKYWSENPI